MGESLGPAVRLNRGYEHYWAYVSHFVHAPFYVYAYAFGNLLVEALMEAAKANRYGHRDATMILVAFRHGLQAAEPSISSMTFIH